MLSVVYRRHFGILGLLINTYLANQQKQMINNKN